MAHFLSQNWLLNRRHVLRGLGISLALPLLDCMRPLGAENGAANGAANTTSRAKRSVFIYLPNGVNTIDYQITQAGTDYTLSKSLQPLEKHRANITPISGLYHPHGLGHHHNCSTIWLTGGKIGQSERNTISVDQLMAQVTAPLTRYSSLELSNQGHSLAYTADGIGLPAQGNPGVVFRDMFEAPQGGIAAQRRGLQCRGSILDTILGEARLLGDQLGQDDRGRLEQYLTSVREVEIRTERADKWLDTPRPTVDPAVQSQLNRDISLERLGDYLRTMYDIIVLAFQTDITRVGTFMFANEGSNRSYKMIGVNDGHHELSHHQRNADKLEGIRKINQFHVDNLAYMLRKMRDVREGDRTLLDNTMVVYGGGIGDGDRHNHDDLPILVAGGAATGLKSGRHIRYKNNTPMTNLFMTMADKAGVPVESIGDSSGRLEQLF